MFERGLVERLRLLGHKIHTFLQRNVVGFSATRHIGVYGCRRDRRIVPKIQVKEGVEGLERVVLNRNTVWAEHLLQLNIHLLLHFDARNYRINTILLTRLVLLDIFSCVCLLIVLLSFTTESVFNIVEVLRVR